MRLLFTVIGIFLLVCAVIGGAFAFVGQRAPVNYEASVEVQIAASPEVVWAALTNISTFIDRYDDISEVELLEADEQGPVQWKIQRGDTSIVVYRRALARPYDRLQVVIDGGNMGIEGGYEFGLAADGLGGTILTAVESTRIDDFVLRAAFAMAGGRDQVLNAQVAEVKAISEAQAG